MRVVVVDDDADVRSEFLAFLLEAGLDAHALGSGEAALAFVASDPSVTVLLTDFSMPDMDGAELALRVHAIRPASSAVEVIILTGRREVRDIGDGAFQILQKPIKLDLLLVVLDNAHRAAMARRQECCCQTR